MKINHCDHGHETVGVVKLLPLSGGEYHGNIIVCRWHYDLEIQHRLSTHWLSSPGFDAFPAWGSLAVYGEEQTSSGGEDG